MNSECSRIADQLRRAFEGKAWHGDCLQELLTDVKASQAQAHPLPKAHSIWEIVLHIGVWERAASGAIDGTPMPPWPWPKELDWPTVTDSSQDSWQKALDQLFATNQKLCQKIEQFGDERLQNIVPGRKYDFYHLFHGITQHSLYHAGQIALLKKQTSA